MADQQADQQQAPQMTPEMFKNTQEIAAQAALRAQQIMFRKSINAPPLSTTTASSSNPTSSSNNFNAKKTAATNGNQPKAPPEVPARGDIPKIPPEIPPKRLSLKKHITGEEIAAAGKIPPPLPQKPVTSSAQNSPQPVPKFKDKTKMPIQRQPLNLRLNNTGAPGTPQMPTKFEKPQPKANATQSARFAQAQHAQSNQMNAQQVAQHGPPTQLVQSTPYQPSQQHPSTTKIATTTSSSTRTTSTPAKKQMSPLEDFSSEDALRGIESGLRNMERAMQEQLTLRSLELAQHEQLNTLEFKQNLRAMAASATSLDGSSQNIHIIESLRMNMAKNMRSMERGFSMDQMRLDNLNLGGMRTMESNPNMRAALDEIKMKGFVDLNSLSGRPVENHMKSLDRNLPLELQYSRHHHNHHRSQSQQEMVDQLRQSAAAMMRAGNVAGGNGGGGGSSSGSGSGSAGMSREDVRLRRRSSHDENQMSQTNNAGKAFDAFLVYFFLF